MKLAIVGSRDYGWYLGDCKPSLGNYYWCGDPLGDSGTDLILGVVSKLSPLDYVVTGGATGADWWAEHSASRHRVGRIIHIPDWDRYGTKAGPIRNSLIVKDADGLMAFYTDKSKSRGTADSVGKARKKGIPVFEFDALTEDTPSWYDTWYEDVFFKDMIRG